MKTCSESEIIVILFIVQVDHGRGVHRKSLLMFDMKSGRYSHIAVQSFTLEEIFKSEERPKVFSVLKTHLW